RTIALSLRGSECPHRSGPNGPIVAPGRMGTAYSDTADRISVHEFGRNRIWRDSFGSSKSWEPQTAPTSLAPTSPVEEPSTTSKAAVMARLTNIRAPALDEKRRTAPSKWER